MESSMLTDTGTLNEVWSKIIVKELVHNGVRLFCLSPGSRSTPLIVAAAEHPLSETHTHFDERGLSYFAIGYAKSTKLPTAIIVTSGTAVSNLLPAVTEAYHDRIPLVILTADRPPELKECGANQTLDQTKIFNNFVQFQIDLPCPDYKVPQNYLGMTIAHAIAKAKKSPGGPVHINCMFRKPFLNSNESLSNKFHQSLRSQHQAQTTFTFGDSSLSNAKYEYIAQELSEYNHGLILVSGTITIKRLESIYSLSRLLQWPIFPDILSNLRTAGPGYGVVPYYDLILRSLGLNEDFTPDGILQIGDRFVSKKLLDWLSSKKPKFHCHINSHSERKDPNHSVTHRVVCEANQFIEKIPSFLSGQSPSKWFQVWKELNDLTERSLSHYFKEYRCLNEPYLMHYLAYKLSDSVDLFLSNSMPIRNADAFFCPIKPVGGVHCNRGLSGIDGNIGSALGVTKGLKKNVVAILGDLAFLHDVNSLAQVQKLPIKIVVINNNGGSIFSFLPVQRNSKLSGSFFQAPHHLHFKDAASLFKLNYHSPKTIEDLEEILNDHGSAIIEIQTLNDQNIKIHKKIHHHLQEVHTRMMLNI